MRCPKCGSQTTPISPICPACQFVLDTSGFGAAVSDGPSEAFGDALILGDLGDEMSDLMGEDTGGFLTLATREVERTLVPAPIYLGGRVAQVLRPEAVFTRTRTATERFDVLTPIERHVIEQIDGTRPVARIRKRAGVAAGDLRIVLAMLLDKQMIELTAMVRPPAPGAPDDGDLDGDAEDALPWAEPEEPAFDDGPTDANPTAISLSSFDAEPAPPIRPPMAPAQHIAARARAQQQARTARLGAGAAATAQPKPAQESRGGSGDPTDAGFVDARRAAIFLELAQKDLAAGRLARGNSYARMAVSLDPANADARELLRTWGKEATRASTGPRAQEDERLFLDAKRAEEHGDYERAVELMRAAIERAVVKAPLYNHLGVILATRLKRYTESATAIGHAIELAPDNDTYKSNLGKVAAAAETTRLKTDPGLFKKLFGAKRPS